MHHTLILGVMAFESLKYEQYNVKIIFGNTVSMLHVLTIIITSYA